MVSGCGWVGGGGESCLLLTHLLVEGSHYSNWLACGTESEATFSHWSEYEFQVWVTVYGSYKLHPYEWAFVVNCTRTTQRLS